MSNNKKFMNDGQIKENEINPTESSLSNQAGEIKIEQFTEDFVDLLTGEKIPVEGWNAKTKNLTIKASRVVGSDQPFGVIFHGGSGDFQELTGKGMINAVREIRPFLEYLDQVTHGNWYASCEDTRREKVYRRWLPPEKIKHE